MNSRKDVFVNPPLGPVPGTASVLVHMSLVVPGTVSILGIQLVPGVATMLFSCQFVPATTTMSVTFMCCARVWNDDDRMFTCCVLRVWNDNGSSHAWSGICFALLRGLTRYCQHSRWVSPGNLHTVLPLGLPLPFPFGTTLASRALVIPCPVARLTAAQRG